jgi:hypothetical protein
VGCDTCPELVVGTIAREVQRTLDKVRRIKALTTMFNRLFSEVAGKIQVDLEALVALIPEPPVLDISDIVAYYTCPLTPVALEIDLTILQKMDPREVGVRLRRILREESNAVVRLYEEAVLRSADYNLLRLLRSYLREMYRVMEDASEFILEYPINAGRAALVKVLCPAIYADSSRPFKALIDELTTWSFDGILPSGVDERGRAVMRILARAEAKLLAWRTVGTVVI